MLLTSHEKIVGLRYLPTDPKQLRKIVKLPVYVTAYSHRRLHRLKRLTDALEMRRPDCTSFVTCP